MKSKWKQFESQLGAGLFSGASVPSYGPSSYSGSGRVE